MATGYRYDLGSGDDSGKFARTITSPIWHYGIVTSIDDPYDAGRIKVRIYGPATDGLDDGVSVRNQNEDFDNPVASSVPGIEGLPWCEPLLPKFINVVPKVGEMVKIVTFDYRYKKVRRQYIGPVIGQQTALDLKNSNYNDAKLRVENKTYTAKWSSTAGALDGSWKIYPNKEDIAILGRVNTDLILRDESVYNEIILRAGKIKSDTLTQTAANRVSPYVLNTKNPAYVTINFTNAQSFNNNILTSNNRVTNNVNGNNLGSVFVPNNLNLQKDRSHINLVADKINLISHEGSNKKGPTQHIIKSEDVVTQIKIENEKLHPVAYGDVLWEFLSVLRPYVEGHIHKASRREPDGDITKNNLIKWFNDNMGSQVTKSNPDGTQYVDIENCKFLSRGVKTN